MSTMFWVSFMLPLSIFFILPAADKKFRVQLTTDPAVAIMFGVAALLTLAFPVVTEVAVRTHNFTILKDLMLAVGVFALVGIVFGLTRTLRSKKNRIA